MLRAAGHEVLGVAGEVHATPLPGRAQELLADRLDEARMVVADDQADTLQPALDEQRMNRGQAEPSSLPAAELEPQDPALAVGRDPDRDERGHGHDVAALADACRYVASSQR